MSDEVKVFCGNCEHEWRQVNEEPYECPKCASHITCSEGAGAWDIFPAWAREWRSRRAKIDAKVESFRVKVWARDCPPSKTS